MNQDAGSEVLFIGGRAGVGKSTTALEVSHLLAAAHVEHAVIEGDNLDLAYPEPWRRGLGLAEQNLGAMWANYRRAGYRRLVFTNTVSVVRLDVLTATLGGDVHATAVLLTASDRTARARLATRETGPGLDSHIRRSDDAARMLEAEAPHRFIASLPMGARSPTSRVMSSASPGGLIAEPRHGRFCDRKCPGILEP